jgi:hypothetical protein
MPLYKGTTEIAGGKLYKGTTEIDKLYKGTNLLYQNQISFNANFLIAGGGGGGGQCYNISGDSDGYEAWIRGGGGGGGGVRTSYSGATPVANGGGQSIESLLALQTGTAYAIVVGDGGTQYQLGGESSIANLVAVGGGGSNYNSRNTINSRTVASNGGGGDGSTRGHTGPTGQPFPLDIQYAPYGTTNGPSGTYGFDGGTGSPAPGSSTYLWGNSTASNGGGAGSTAGLGITSNITGSNITFGAGGSATNSNNPAQPTQPTAPGQGGNGGASANQDYGPWHRTGAQGAAGAVIIRFSNTRNYTATGSPTLTTDGSDKILQWTTAGTYTITFT